MLLICEQALGQGETEIAEMFYPKLNSIEQSIYQFRIAQLGNDAELAQTHLTTALQNSRTRELRDHMLEARIRMEWGILRASIGEHEQAGVDLRWAMERLGALSEGHRWHGLCILNMAKWHQNRGELGMALAMHSEISRNGPHHIEIIAVSRRMLQNCWLPKIIFNRHSEICGFHITDFDRQICWMQPLNQDCIGSISESQM